MPLPYSVSPQDFGAIGDGIADDTAAVQAAVTAAAPKGIVFFPQGIYKVTSPISITSGINLRGVGTESIWKAATLGSVVKVMGDIIGFNVVCDDSVTIEKLEFVGGSGSASGTMLQIDTDNSSGIKCNYGSIIRDCIFLQCKRGIYGLNILNYTFDNNGFYNISFRSCQTEAANSPGNGDASLINNTFSGQPISGHFSTGTMGGLRILNNKFNCANGAGGIALLFNSTTASAMAISPLLICGNSIEGVNYGLCFQRQGAGAMTCNNLVICNNEIVVGVSGRQFFQRNSQLRSLH